MKRMGNMAKRFVAVAMSLAMAAGIPGANLKAFATQGLDSVQAASAVTRSSIHDGTILHTFCWNFNTIREKMPEIAAAGYTAIQTSPINECLAIHPGMALYGDTEDEGRWYYHYQPTDWKIGNYQLGSRDEFKAMCDEAEKYGIGVIVDIAPNHTTPLYDYVSEDLKAAAGGEDALYHIGAKVEDGDQGGMQYDNHISVTYDAMGGLPDVDTENHGFQEYFYDFLEDCIACGADGFRIDTAKHIALPDDGVAEEYAGQEDRNDFYPNMKADIDAYASKNYADLFVYGEVLDGDTSRVAAYQDMLGGTVASNYGGAIRNAASSGNVSVKKLSSYKVSDDTSTGKTYTADENKLVTWVESHDNYINDHSYNEVDDKEVILGWAIIAAREAGTPLFFSRPDGSNAENPWGNNRIGEAGSDLYKAPEVVAVNKFRTAMEGESENLRNPGNNASVLMIERGNKGVVIVNAGENDFALDSETNLSDGTYVDSVEGRTGLYTVSDGNIYGTVPAKSVVVLDTLADGDYSTIFFHNTDGWNSVSALACDNSFACDYTQDNWWKVTVPAKEFKVVFTDGVNKSAEFSVGEGAGRFMTAKSDKIYASKAEAEEALGIVTKTVYFLNTEEWKSVYAYAWTDGTQHFGGWPGAAISNEEGYWWKAEVKMIGDQDFSIIFNNNDGAQTVDISMDDMSKNVIAISADQPGGNLVVDKYSSKAEAEEATGINGSTTTVYYYNAAGWDNVGVYTWGDVDLGGWPGQQCEYEGDGWWKKTINCTPSSNFNIIFNNFVQGDDGKRQTEDMKCDSLKKVYFIGAKYKYASKAAALKALENDNLKLEKNLHPELDPPEEPTERPVEEETALNDGEVKIYYYNKANWDEVNMYAWTDGANTEYFGGWPGKAMQHIGGNWYSVSVSEKALSHEGLHLIANGDGSQIDNVALISERPNVNEKPSEPEPSAPEEPTEPEKKVREIQEEKPLADGEARVYVKLEADEYFDGANAYIWTDGENHEYLGGWPGKPMTHIGNGWYSINVPKKVLSSQEDKVEEVVETAEEETEAEEGEITEEVVEDSEENVAEEISEDAEPKNLDEVVEESNEETVAEADSEEVVEETADESDSDEDSLLEEIKEVLTSLLNGFVSAFRPMEAKAAESQIFAEGIHVIVNNGKGCQNNDVNAWFTDVRPSAEELKQEEPAEEPETPVPAPASGNTGSGSASSSTSSSGSGSSASSTSSSTKTTSTASTATKTVQQPVTVAEAQVPLAAPEVKVADNSVAKKSATKSTKVASTKTEETVEDEVTEEDVVEEKAELPAEETVEADETVPEDEAEVEIADEEVPTAAVEEGGVNPGVVVAIVVAVAAVAGAAGFIVVRKRR